MKDSTVKFLVKPRLKKPILIEGLPGMGYVGKLAAEQLIAELHAEKFAEIYSPYFPHHVYIEEGGITRPVRNEFYRASSGGKGMIILVGDVQAISPEGHYGVTDKILDVAEQFGVEQLFTLGGYATGRHHRAKPRVLGVVSHPELVDAYSKYGIVIEEGGGPIIGAAGLLLGLGKLRGMRGICLLGETHGIVVDHRSAQAVLEVLTHILGIKVDVSALELHAKETERIMERVRREMELRERKERGRAEEEAWYIG